MALPTPSSLRVSIELAREKVFFPPFPVRCLRRRVWLLGSLFFSLDSEERDFAARACLRRPLTARVKADWGAELAGWLGSCGLVGDGVRDSGMVDSFGGISDCSFVKPSPEMGLGFCVEVLRWGGLEFGFVTALSWPAAGCVSLFLGVGC